MSVKAPCKLKGLPKPFNEPTKPYDVTERSDVTRRWRTLNKGFDAAVARTLGSPEANARKLKQAEVASKQSEWMLNVTDVSTLLPRNVGRLKDWLARNFAVEYDDFMQTQLSDVGGVRQKVRRMQALVNTKTADQLAQIEMLDALEGAQKRAYQIMRKLQPDMQHQLWVGAMEEGQFPRTAARSAMPPMMLYRMGQKHDKFLKKALNEGLSEDQVRELILEATTVTTAYDEGLLFAKGTNSALDEVSGLEYFRRQFTPDVAAIIAKTKAIEEGGLANTDNVRNSFQASRVTTEFIVEDEHLLAYMLGKPMSEAKKLISDTNLLTYELSKLEPEKLDSLVKNHIISKLPFTSNEMYPYLVKQYELPISGINEMFIVDQKQAYTEYVHGLKNLVAKSTILQSVFKHGMDNGWAITALEKSQGGYDNFVQLNYGDLTKFVSPDAVALANQVGAVYVHPVVRDVLESTLKLATSPAKMGVAADVVHHMSFIMQNSKKLMLVFPRYVINNAIGGLIMSFAAGGNLLTAVPNMVQYSKVHRFGGKILDDTKKVYAGGTLTERGLYQTLKETGGLTDVIPGVGINPHHKGYNSWNVKQAQQAARYAWFTLQKFGLSDGIKKVEDLVSNLVDAPAMYLGGIANFTDNAFRWNTYKTILQDGVLNQAAQFLSTGQVRYFGSDVGEARKWVDRYFFDYSNQGQADEVLSKYIFPFWLFFSRNLPTQLRHVVSNPQQYLAYHRIHALMNEHQIGDEGDKLPDGAVSDFTKKSFPLYYKTGDNDYFAVHTTGFDPIADGFTNFQALFNDVEYRVLKKYSGTEKQKRDQVRGVSPIEFLEKNVDTIYPLWKSVVQGLQFLSGAERDALTGKPLKDSPEAPTAFVGFRTHPLFRMFLEQNVPFLSMLNTMNPGDKFGKPLKLDEKGNITQLPEPSFAGAPRSDKDMKNIWLRAGASIGSSMIQPLDPVTRAINMGYTEADMKDLDRELSNRVKTINLNYPTYTPQQKEDAKKDIENAKHVLFSLRLDLARIKAWRVENGIPAAKVAKELALRKLSIPDLPVVFTEEDGRRTESLREAFNTFDLMVQQEKNK